MIGRAALVSGATRRNDGVIVNGCLAKLVDSGQYSGEYWPDAAAIAGSRGCAASGRLLSPLSGLPAGPLFGNSIRVQLAHPKADVLNVR